MELKLKKLKKFNGRMGPLLFVIMDGIGIGKHDEGDAVFQANTPELDELIKMPLYCQLKAHGLAVGLPGEGDMGNSEVGHNAFGAGRIFAQGAKLVNISIGSGKIFTGKTWEKVTEKGIMGGTVHFIGLLSNGNVHSHIDHLFAMIKRCALGNIKKVRVHILLDGRDVDKQTALNYIKPLEELLSKINIEKKVDYKIASGGGRMITTMDRYEADWKIVERGWKTHVLGDARKFGSAEQAVLTYYEEGCDNDQFLPPFVIVDERKNPVGTIEDGDSVIYFNFRGDRAIEISMAFEKEDFDKFDRKRFPDVYFAGMMEYDGDFFVPKNYLVEPPDIDRTVSEYLCAAGVKMFAISETQKYGHVTYFWNGNRSGYINDKLETYIKIPSDNIPFERTPGMKAFEITEKTIELLKTGQYRFGRVNFANGDMVGHTGVMEAAVEAVETVDKCLLRLRKAITKLGGIMVVTADHGNADEMFVIKDGKRLVKTSHTLNPVPFAIYDPLYNNEYKMAKVEKPGLTNVAATLLNLLGFEKVEDYDDSLIEFN